MWKIVVAVLWALLGIGVAINFAYYGVMFAGAWLTINEAPTPPISTSALAFIGAAMLILEQVFPWLRAHQ